MGFLGWIHSYYKIALKIKIEYDSILNNYLSDTPKNEYLVNSMQKRFDSLAPTFIQKANFDTFSRLENINDNNQLILQIQFLTLYYIKSLKYMPFKDDYKFNHINVACLEKSYTVKSGQIYSSDIVLTAIDTTQRPVIYIGKYELIKDKAGNVLDYKMIGEYDRIPIVNGRGQYRYQTSSPGIKKFSGLYELKKSNGTIIHIPFQKEFIVTK